MKKSIVIMIALITLTVPALAELQNVTIDGSLRIRGNYYTSPGVFDSTTASNPLYGFRGTRGIGVGVRRTPGEVAGRAVGTLFGAFGAPGAAAGITNAGIFGGSDFSDRGPSFKNFEQRTILGVNADFTNEVSARIAFDSYDVWGEDFRSDYITGADGRAASFNDVEVYEAYIQAEEMWGLPLGMRIGRQEIQLGSEWLVGNNDTSAFFRGLSFDGIRAWYTLDALRIDAIYTKLAENSGLTNEEDGDVDMYALYGTYSGIDDITLEAYWIYIRDARQIEETIGVGLFQPLEWVEDFFGVDDYKTTQFHTVGLRGAGTVMGAIDFEAEVAYQFGDAATTGALFSPGLYGDDGADYSALGVNVEVGYTIDMNWQPRVYLGFAFMEGEDNRDEGFLDWVAAVAFPWHEPDASVSFNRIFSDWEYSEFISNTDLSNVLILRGGVSANITESLEAKLALSYFQADEPFDAPVTFIIPVLGTRFTPLPFWTTENDDELGWELGLYLTYAYSEDLTFEVGYAHFFTGDGLDAEGSFVNFNGLGFLGGVEDDDPNYFYIETRLAF